MEAGHPGIPLSAPRSSATSGMSNSTPASARAAPISGAGALLGYQDVCDRQFTDMSEGGAAEFRRISQHDDSFGAFYHLPDHAGLSKIGSREAALGGHAADADECEIGVKGMCPASLDVRKFDWSERGKGDHTTLSADDV